MYAIKRSDGLFLCDGAVYTDRQDNPKPIWQDFEGTRHMYLEGRLPLIRARCERLGKIYTAHTLSVHELTPEQEEYLSFRKLRGH